MVLLRGRPIRRQHLIPMSRRRIRRPLEARAALLLAVNLPLLVALPLRLPADLAALSLRLDLRPLDLQEASS